MHIERRFEAPFRRIICGLVFIVLLAQGWVRGATNADFKKLYFDKQYFELRDALRDYPGPRTGEWLFYRGAVSNKFNRSRLSIQYLNRYLKKASGRPDNALLIECYELLADNYRKTYQYQKAAQANRTLLTKFGFQLEKKASADYRNELKLWSALAKVPPQTTTFRGDSIVDQDKEGHFPIEINGRKVALPFDSGANLSVVTSSLAKQLGLQVIETSIDVGAVAGNKVKGRLAVVREMKIGNVAIRNPVFLVFDDHDLYIAEANFQIHGVIGFPVIESLRQITFVRGKGIIVPATPLNGGEQNMCLDGFSPLITGRYKG